MTYDPLNVPIPPPAESSPEVAPLTYDPLNVPIPPPAESSPEVAPLTGTLPDPGDHGPDVAPANPHDPTTFPRFPTSQGPDLAAPGPHPHEASDADRLSGEAFLYGNDPTVFIDPDPVPPPAGITGTLPGPHIHRASDVRDNGGLVAGWRDPMEGFSDDNEAGH